MHHKYYTLTLNERKDEFQRSQDLVPIPNVLDWRNLFSVVLESELKIDIYGNLSEKVFDIMLR